MPLRCLDTAAQIRVEEGHVAIHRALAGILNRLTIHRLEHEGGEALDILALGRLRLLLRTYHANLALRIADLHHAVGGELCKGWLGRLTVATPIGVVHCKSVLCRGTALEALEEFRGRELEAEADGGHEG